MFWSSDWLLSSDLTTDEYGHHPPGSWLRLFYQIWQGKATLILCYKRSAHELFVCSEAKCHEFGLCQIPTRPLWHTYLKFKPHVIARLEYWFIKCPKHAFIRHSTVKVYSKSDIMYGLLTKREVKMAGYWPSSFFVCLWTETKSRSINTQKKNEANIQPSWPNKVGQKRIYYMG